MQKSGCLVAVTELSGLARRVMNWMLVVAALALYLVLTLPEASRLASEIHRIARYVATEPSPDNLPSSIRTLGEIPTTVPIANLEIRWFLAIEDSDVQDDLFVTSGRHQPLGHQPKGWQPLFPDPRLKSEFFVALTEFRKLAEQYGDSLTTVRDLDESIAISSDFPYSLLPKRRIALILLLAGGLSAQLLYFWSVLNTMKASLSATGIDRSWIFFHEGRVASILAFIWMIAPSFLVYCAAVQWTIYDNYTNWIGYAVVILCWIVVVFSLFVWNAGDLLRQEFLFDQVRE